MGFFTGFTLALSKIVDAPVKLVNTVVDHALGGYKRREDAKQAEWDRSYKDRAQAQTNKAADQQLELDKRLEYFKDRAREYDEIKRSIDDSIQQFKDKSHAKDVTWEQASHKLDKFVSTLGALLEDARDTIDLVKSMGREDEANVLLDEFLKNRKTCLAEIADLRGRLVKMAIEQIETDSQSYNELVRSTESTFQQVTSSRRLLK